MPKSNNPVLRFVRAFRALSYKLTYTGYSDPLKHVRSLVKFGKSGSVLDVGAGQQQYREVLSTLGNYVSIDIVPGADLIGSIYELPFENESADTIGLFMVMEHLAEPKAAVKECSRVLKKDGVLLITTPQYWHFHSWPNDYFRYTKEGLRHICTENGLEVVEMRSMGGPFLVLFHVINVNLRLYGGSFRRLLLCNPLITIFNFLDFLFFRHQDKRAESDSVGWAVAARKK
ncbi:MAG TPA: class I SAM-dependent methyltransferase [Bacteroidota bacterium]|nr:class I SAM-dependent methyltransferase [Bacteroidota bacterium]